jgi:hypothetical protein
MIPAKDAGRLLSAAFALLIGLRLLATSGKTSVSHDEAILVTLTVN